MATDNRLNGPIDETTLRVRYAETDAMGIVHHSQYVIWFEVGRSSFMRHTGFSYADLERAGYHLRIAEVRARYVAPAFYDECLTVRTWLSEVHSRGLAFSYAIVRPGDMTQDLPERTLVTGTTTLICTDSHGQVRRMPNGVRAVLQAMVAA